MSKHVTTPKLTEDKVIRIRERAHAGEMQVELARLYEVSTGAVSMIVNGQTWRHVGGPIRKPKLLPTETDSEWRSVPGYEGIYSASESGHIRIEVDRRGMPSGSILRQTVGKDGYLFVGLNDGSNKSKSTSIARTILASFRGPAPSDRHLCNHKNGDRTDNRLENLEWMTLPENIRHSIEVLGYTRQGEQNPAAKLTEELVLELRKRAEAGETYTSLGQAYDITTSMARMIATGKAWKHVGGQLQGKRPIGRPPKAG